MLKAIVGLTAGYALAVAVAFSDFTNSDVGGPAIFKLLFAEAVFALPMILCCILAFLIRRVNTHRILLGFEILFWIVSVGICVSTFTGEHDAQYQLALLFIPLFGFPTVVIVGVVAALVPAERRAD